MRLEIDQSDLDKFLLIQLVSVEMQAPAHDSPLKPRGEDRIEHAVILGLTVRPSTGLSAWYFWGCFKYKKSSPKAAFTM